MQDGFGSDLGKRLAEALSPAVYLESIGIKLFEWQKFVLSHPAKRKALLCARQSGKSFVVAGEAAYNAKYHKKSLTPIVSPSKDQSAYTMGKVADLIGMDSVMSDMVVRDSLSEKELSNGSLIFALPGTERSVRGYSKPRSIIFDEAARILEGTYRAARPMLTASPDATIWLPSTPFGNQGFFYNAWEFGKEHWLKVMVVPAYQLRDGKIVDREPEDRFQERWLERGVHAFYSPQHSPAWLEEELNEIGEYWFRQEYMCEFLDAATSVFNSHLIHQAMADEIDPLFLDKDLMVDVEVLEF